MTRITMFTLSGLILVTVVHCVIGTGKNYISFYFASIYYYECL